jgi:capsule polysaccharide export protein KpsE/RkpR
MDERLSFQNFFETVVRHWKLFAAVALVAGGAGAIFSGRTFIKPRFRSSAIVYPVNLASYSIESTSDQLLQLLESNSIRDSLVRIHHLAEHYDINVTEPPGQFYLEAEYRDHVSISKTRYESVQVEIEDEDPRIAQAMVGDLLDQCNKLARRLQREKSEEVLRITQHEMDVVRHKLDSVDARLDTLRKSTGLLNYDAQTQEVTRGYMRLLSSGNAGGRAEANDLLRALSERGGEFHMLTELANSYRSQFIEKQAAHERILTDMSKELTYANVVVYPERADKKVYPVRWLIVLISMASACFLCLVLLMLRDRRKVPDPQTR